MIEIQEIKTETQARSMDFPLDPVIKAAASSGQREAVYANACQLATKNFVSTEFLNDPAAQFFLLAIAERSLLIQQALSNNRIRPDQAIAENLLTNDMLVLLAGVAHKNYLLNRDNISPRLALSEEEIYEAHQDYANPGLSQELTIALEKTKQDQPESLLPRDEQPYEIIALNILSARAISRQMPQDPSPLQENSDRFAARTRQDGILGCAWTIRFGSLDRSVIGVPYDTAESILSGKDEVKLRHEFYHTQYPLNTVGLGFFMLLVEEQRVKRLSGDSDTYQDIDKFFYSLNQATGVDLVSSATSLSPDGAYKFLLAAAKAIGTQRTLELALTLPKDYLHGHTPLPISVSQRLGGTQALLDRIRRR